MKASREKLFYLLLFILLSSLCSSPERRTIILCAGDSITETNYPRFLQKMCRSEGIKAKVLNFGRSGYTSGEYLDFLVRNDKILAAERPDFILLQLGTNDVRLDSDSTTPDEFYSNIKKITEIFHRFKNLSNKETQILLATIPPIPENCTFPFSPESSARVTDEINPLIKRICAEEKILLVDNYSLFIRSPHLLSDVHPTHEGYKLLAQNWFDALKPLL